MREITTLRISEIECERSLTYGLGCTLIVGWLMGGWLTGWLAPPYQQLQLDPAQVATMVPREADCTFITFISICYDTL